MTTLYNQLVLNDAHPMDWDGDEPVLNGADDGILDSPPCGCAPLPAGDLPVLNLDLGHDDGLLETPSLIANTHPMRAGEEPIEAADGEDLRSFQALIEPPSPTLNAVDFAAGADDGLLVPPTMAMLG